MTKIVPSPGPTAAPSGKAALDVLRALPPEAVVKVVDIIGDVVRSRARLAEKHDDFLRDMAKMRETNDSRTRVMSTLSALLLDAELNDDAKLRLVNAICELALR